MGPGVKKLKLPYGLSNFSTIVREGYYYVDKTHYIERLEALNERYIFFLRPRRFGKSLFVSILSYYYGLECKEKFEELFGKYYIGNNPTPRVNSYYTITFNFSRIDTTNVESTFKGFLFYIKLSIEDFNRRYKVLSKDQMENILNLLSPNEVISRFFEYFETEISNSFIYILIDEYDHFANEIISFNFDEFKNIVSGNGFVRKFFEAIKAATQNGIVDRIFATGVTPITLDSLTSGFNIACNITTEEPFNEMMGFMEVEVDAIIDALCKGCPECDKENIMADLITLYNGYLFNKEAGERIYNPDMVLYFTNSIVKHKKCKYPDEILDKNIASDYGKIRNLTKIKNTDQNMSALKEIIENDVISATLTKQYSFEKEFDVNDFLSLIFYNGLITIKGAKGSDLEFKIPNYVIKKLYWDFFMSLVQQDMSVTIDTRELKNAIYDLAYDNKVKGFIQFIERSLQALSNRDYIRFSEKYIKLLFMVYANLTDIYFIKSEAEAGRGYPDLMLLRRPPFDAKYQFLFELKYVKREEEKSKGRGKKKDRDKARIESAREEAIRQVKSYLEAEEMKGLENLRAYVVVFHVDRLVVLEEVANVKINT